MAELSNISVMGVGGGVSSAAFMLWFSLCFSWFGLMSTLKDWNSLKS